MQELSRCPQQCLIASKTLQCSHGQGQSGRPRGLSLLSTCISAFRCIDPPDTDYYQPFVWHSPFSAPSWGRREHIPLAGMEKQPRLPAWCVKQFPQKKKRQKFRAQLPNQVAAAQGKCYHDLKLPARKPHYLLVLGLHDGNLLLHLADVAGGFGNFSPLQVTLCQQLLDVLLLLLQRLLQSCGARDFSGIT